LHEDSIFGNTRDKTAKEALLSWTTTFFLPAAGPATIYEFCNVVRPVGKPTPKKKHCMVKKENSNQDNIECAKNIFSLGFRRPFKNRNGIQTGLCFLPNLMME
jgi:hypothetical protein